jgi:hypothetical protein
MGMTLLGVIFMCSNGWGNDDSSRLSVQFCRAIIAVLEAVEKTVMDYRERGIGYHASLK